MSKASTTAWYDAPLLQFGMLDPSRQAMRNADLTMLGCEG